MMQSNTRQADNDNPALSQVDVAPQSANTALLAELRHTISRIEKDGAVTETELEPTAQISVCDAPPVEADDGAAITLPQGWVHELWAQAPMDMQAATSLMLAANKAGDRPLVWVTSRSLTREHGLPYGPGLLSLGIDPARIILVRCDKQADVLWTLEECLKSSALATVVGELEDIDLTASRRLTLMAREYGTRCLLMLRASTPPSTAAYSRWRTSMKNSLSNAFDPGAPGAARLQANLTKHRGGERPQTRVMEWSHATDTVPLATTMADRPVVSGPPVRKQIQRATG